MLAQKSSICKRCAATDGERRGNSCGGCGGNGSGGGHSKCQRKNWRNCDPKSAKYHALAKSVATLSKNVNVMVTHMSGCSDKDDDTNPADDGKMASNAKNSALYKTPKRRRNYARLSLMGASCSGLMFVLLSLLSL